MPPTGGDQGFASVAVASNGERKLMLNTKRVGVSEVDVGRGKKLIAAGGGPVKVAPPEGYSEVFEIGIVLSKCMNGETYEVMNLSVEEIRPKFQRWVE